ncbi:MAG: Rieske 2Fe-2S domain-containing protein [Myxococcales bacterium]|nr:Rieske 2Fe-2S domain-containing protein [Myxococcales bacterium]
MIAASLRRVLCAADAPGRPLPALAYTDAGLFALEREAFFAPSRMALASPADLPRPGSWVRVPGRCDSLLVTRQGDLSLAAVHGVCTHRGAALVDEDAGERPSLTFTCRYHGWCFALGGALVSAPFTSTDFDRAAAGLDAHPVHEDATWVMGAEMARQALPPWLAAGALAPLRRLSKRTLKTAANWKLIVENFQESQHFGTVHPGLEARTPSAASRSVITDAPWLGGTMQLAPHAETVSRSMRTLGRPSVHRGDPRTVFDAYLWPNVLTSLQPDYLLTYALFPEAVDRTTVVAEIWLHARATDLAQHRDDLDGFWQRTNLEDQAVVEAQQRGLGYTTFRARQYLAGEDGLQAFDLLYLRNLRAALGTP